MLKFIKLQAEHLALLLDWRTQPEVTKYMFSDIEYNYDKQLQWYEAIINNPNERYWVIELNDRLIGLVSLNNIQWRDRRCYWGFYIGEADARIYGGLIGPYVYRYVFEELGFKKIMGEIMEGNENVRKIQIIQGCREVGVLKDHVYKYDKFHNVYVLEMLNTDWLHLKHRYGHCIAEFDYYY
ncbi:UDP-4-amino-4,6-dideoxy-N-acetyl-beta-L-altrosamine N-acetyltransferase [Paenibacillus forsythiae]|uniref:UDP-4-amino-4, 6-dideoxy-N-acetyl-beta-L-altrosamine N-acetyltransferase n=1 Tax=Paenibacillus forsythiae TaxID=365616 RepID=A0ABU3HB07_9BACL|nr:UDP-4-amino-4,6-dideoxy-N-acetyl-beta-L-altrosamine N-acetyltransferase [Paenibacillus forsythiae]MDT3427998.1 UDP-4-amino-4,6-dideoxy-N-acetyl-beta-L-altrosamine N-acetyltransferase [Paenibacillus forsythiae]